MPAGKPDTRTQIEIADEHAEIEAALHSAEALTLIIKSKNARIRTLQERFAGAFVHGVGVGLLAGIALCFTTKTMGWW